MDMAKHTLKESRMWHVIQTITGEEENLIGMIRKMIPKNYYIDCFCIKREIARKGTEGYKTCLEMLFPAYVFVISDKPKELYYELKNIPKLTKLLRSEDEVFLAVSEEEQRFLENVQNEDHVVERSLVKVDEEGQIIAAKGAVGRYMGCIVRQRLRKRYVWIEQYFFGKKRRILLGIRLEED